MNKKKRTIVWIVILIIILTGAGGAGSIYYYFFAKQFQLTKTTYIYIDRDDNLDSVYHKIIRNGHPKSMFGFNIWQKKRSMATIYGQDVTLSIHRTICATSSDVFPWDTRLPLI